MEWRNVRITPGFFLLMAWLYYCGQGRVAALAVLASAVHELAHYVFLRLYGVRVERLIITAVGAEMTVRGQMSYIGETVSAAAGPISNLLLARIVLWTAGERGYLFAGINLILAVFNLLPVAGLDGGRCLACMAEWAIGPNGSERLCRTVEVAVLTAAVLAGGTVFVFGKNMTGLLASAWLCANCSCRTRRINGKRGLSFRLRTGKMVHV